jgi:hypothetical protein
MLTQLIWVECICLYWEVEREWGRRTRAARASAVAEAWRGRDRANLVRGVGWFCHSSRLMTGVLEVLEVSTRDDWSFFCECLFHSVFWSVVREFICSGERPAISFLRSVFHAIAHLFFLLLLDNLASFSEGGGDQHCNLTVRHRTWWLHRQTQCLSSVGFGAAGYATVVTHLFSIIKIMITRLRLHV